MEIPGGVIPVCRTPGCERARHAQEGGGSGGPAAYAAECWEVRCQWEGRVGAVTCRLRWPARGDSLCLR